MTTNFICTCNKPQQLLNHKNAETGVVMIDENAGAFEGYASLWNIPDSNGDVVMPGAFSNSINNRNTKSIKMLFQHDPSKPIGVWQEITEDNTGLLVKGKLNNDVRRSREVLSLLRSGAIDGLSIGFKAIKSHRNNKSGNRVLSKIDLWEISIVTFPMMPQARIHHVKSFNYPSLQEKYSPENRMRSSDYHNNALEFVLWAACEKTKSNANNHNK